MSNLAVAVGTNCFFTRPLSAVWDEDDAGSRLADEIRLSIDYYMTQPQAKPVGEVVLSGPGSADGQLVEGLETHLGIPVDRAGAARPARRLGARPERGPAPLHGRGRPLAGSRGVKPVNLIPQDQRRRGTAEGDGKSAPIVLGVLGVLLAMVVVYVLTSNTVTERKSDADGRERRGRPARGARRASRPATPTSPRSP